MRVQRRRAPFSCAFALLVVALTSGCRIARAPVVSDPWPERLRVADAAAAEGCYRCLERALREYDAGAAAGHADPTLGARAHRVAVHLAVRERLLGLFPGTYQDAPARWAAAAPADDVAAAADVVPAVTWRRGTATAGVGPFVAREDVGRLRTRRVALEARADADPWVATLLLALVGTNPVLGLDEGQRPAPGALPGLEPATWAQRHPDDPPLGFTRLVLLRSSIDDLDAFRATHASFAELDVIAGEAELARGRLVSADETLARALAEFPSLVPALALRGDLRQRMEDYALAVDLYTTLLARLPDHREALLGLTKSLGFMGRHAEAIAAADRMLALGTWYMGEAFYWKAWNLYTIGRLDAARASVDDARRLLVNADVHYLGGVIAFKQGRHDDAGTDFDAAIDLESRHCEAHFDRAALRLTRRAWPVAAAGFDEAFECLDARTPVLEQRIVDAREARLADAAREALVQRREQALRDHRHQQAWARYNGGVGYANAGNPVAARARAGEAITIGGPAAEAAERLLPQLPPLP